MFKKITGIGLFSALCVGCTSMAQSQQAQNVILFIGDGMGPNTIAATAYAAHGMVDKGEGLYFENFPVMGYTTTHTSNSLVADSAATATAMSSGIKTYNGAIGVDDSQNPVETILEWATDRGLATGLVTSVQINHATPAGFGAHENSRNNYSQIMNDYFTAKDAQVLLGGGVRNVAIATALTNATAAGYTAMGMDDVNSISTIQPGDRVFGVFDEDDDGHLAYQTKRLLEGSDEPELIDLTMAAITALSNDPDGFFLMVEGGAIDWSNHANDAENAINETLELERTVEATVDALGNMGKLDETLIIITADHECGGLCITGPYESTLPAGTTPQIEYISTNHTALPVHTFSMGPGSAALEGRHDNTDIYQAMKDALSGPTGMSNH